MSEKLKRLMKSRNYTLQLRLKFVVIFIVLIAVLITGVMLLPQKTERVDNKDLEKYVKCYLEKYREVVEENFNLVHDISMYSLSIIIVQRQFVELFQRLMEPPSFLNMMKWKKPIGM